MIVFVCWSGVASHRVAQMLHDWLGDVIHSLRPFMSSESIRKGTRWGPEISGQLAEANFGMICLTKENLRAPWIHFEAGALAKNMREGRVAVVLLGIEPADVEEPLSQFQSTRVSRDDFYKLIRDLNALLPVEHQLSAERLERSFDIHWPRLERGISEALRDEKPGGSLLTSGHCPNQTDTVGFLFTQPELVVLRLLREAAMGMYGLQLVQKSDGQLRRGSVYITLNRLEERGFVVSKITAGAHSALLRRLYTVTPLGVRALAVAQTNWLDLRMAGVSDEPVG